MIRMLEHTIGSTAFETGIHRYLKQHQFSNVETNDLWLSFNRLTKVHVGSFMETWIFQKGYPVISVIVNREERTLKFIQNPFPNDSGKKYNESESPFGFVKFMLGV